MSARPEGRGNRVVRRHAPECKAIGCRRKTFSPHGYCWQHAAMALPIPARPA
jgi:hypothetical protein